MVFGTINQIPHSGKEGNVEYTHGSYGEKPKDYLKSVDLSLLLIAALRDHGEVHITDAAKTFGVSPSTIHRSMSMLVYRGFALPSPRRTYVAGPSLNAVSLQPRFGSSLFEKVGEYLKLLAAETGETCHLTITKGRKTHYIASVEGTQPLRIGRRKGQVMPADKCSGGQATLARLSASELRSLYHDLPEDEFRELRKRLHKARERGFAVNIQQIEQEISAIGTSLHNELGDTLGAISVSIPTIRWTRESVSAADSLLKAVKMMNRALVQHEVDTW